jgi:tetratricopeptide (TPR) repeat protein
VAEPSREAARERDLADAGAEQRAEPAGERTGPAGKRTGRDGQCTRGAGEPTGPAPGRPGRPSASAAAPAEPSGLGDPPGVRGHGGVHYPAVSGPSGEFAAAELATGLELRQKRRLAAAVTYFERAVEADPGLVEGWFWLGVTRDNLGREADAVPAYRRALLLGIGDPNRQAQAQMWLASSLSKTGQHQAALAALATAAKLGGYEPAGEYIRLRRAIWRRSAPRRRPRRPPPGQDR